MRSVCPPDVARHLAAVRAAMLHSLRHAAVGGPVLGGLAAVQDYLRALLGCETDEVFLVLYLGSGRRVLGEQVLATGSVDKVQVHPRTVLRRALELGATAIILVHNHPSGDSAASKADIAMTRTIVRLGQGLEIAVYDHIIVSRAGCTSMREAGLL